MPVSPKTHTSRTLPPPFIASEAQRLALAREQFFEEGVRPSGVVSEGVIQSWNRCLQAHRKPGEPVEFDLVTRSRIHTAQTRNRTLLDVAAHDLRQLQVLLADTRCQAVLTDATGVVLEVIQPVNADSFLFSRACRTGVNLAEEVVATTAPGLVARTGQPCVVRAGEHFFDCLQTLNCAAAPIHDAQRKLVGVLNVSIEAQAFGFDAPSVVILHAAGIENRLLQAQAHEQIVVHLHTLPSMIDTPMEGLIGVDANGKLCWCNDAAARLLGLPQKSPMQDRARPASAHEALGITPTQLAAWSRHREPALHRLPNGLALWLRARLHGYERDAASFHLGSVPAADMAAPPASLAAAAPAAVAVTESASPPPFAPAQPQPPATPISLRAADRQWIAKTLAECGGNVSKAARILGVSRGLIYRHMEKTGGQAGPAEHQRDLRKQGCSEVFCHGANALPKPDLRK
ncbi:MAG: helix-turn-helix domain-containing protein [Burkholderiaceae bacterium]